MGGNEKLDKACVVPSVQATSPVQLLYDFVSWDSLPLTLTTISGYFSYFLVLTKSPSLWVLGAPTFPLAPGGLIAPPRCSPLGGLPVPRPAVRLSRHLRYQPTVSVTPNDFPVSRTSLGLDCLTRPLLQLGRRSVSQDPPIICTNSGLWKACCHHGKERNAQLCGSQGGWQYC